MRSRPRGWWRSVDRGRSRPGIEPRKTDTPGRRRRGAKRKATSEASIPRDAEESSAVRDPEHAPTHLAREPGAPLSARWRWASGPRREVCGRRPTMNGQGQSDRPVVPVKFPNNAGQPAAEGMEGRGLAKGNPSQQNVPRAQHRDGTRSALERVREVAEELSSEVVDERERRRTLLGEVEQSTPKPRWQPGERYATHVEGYHHEGGGAGRGGADDRRDAG